MLALVENCKTANRTFLHVQNFELVSTIFLYLRSEHSKPIYVLIPLFRLKLILYRYDHTAKWIYKKIENTNTNVLVKSNFSRKKFFFSIFESS